MSIGKGNPMNLQNLQGIDYIELDADKLVNNLKQRWATILLLVVLFCTLAFLLTIFEAPSYSASAAVTLLDDKSDPVLDWRRIDINKQLLNDYQVLLGTNRLISKALKNINNPSAVDDIKSRLNIWADEKARIITVNYEDADKRLAAALPNELVRLLAEETYDIIPNRSLRVLYTAREQDQNSSANLPRRIMMGGLAGLIAGCILLLIPQSRKSLYQGE